MRRAGPATRPLRVLVQVQEGPQHRLRFGLGYGKRGLSAGKNRLDRQRLPRGGPHPRRLGAPLEDRRRVAARDDRLQPVVQAVFSDTLWSVDTLNYTLGATLPAAGVHLPCSLRQRGVFAERRSEAAIYTRIAVGGTPTSLSTRGARSPSPSGTVTRWAAPTRSPRSTVASSGCATPPSQVFLRDRARVRRHHCHRRARPREQPARPSEGVS